MTDGEIEQAVLEVEDPVLFASIGSLKSLRTLRRSNDELEVGLFVALEPYPARDELRQRIEQGLGGRYRVRLDLEVWSEAEKAELGLRLLGHEATPPEGAPSGQTRQNPFVGKGGSTRVLGIASGKGGVGKSSVTVNLAVALAGLGHSVGILDADIYGFSVPRMLGIRYPPIVLGRTIVPPVGYGVRCCSMGFFASEQQGVAWRGPMLHGAIEQFLVDVYWGGPQFLLIDMPPGTGDVALSVAQQLPLTEIYLVTTPQPAAQRVAQRSAALAKKLRLPLRGVIENMSYFATPNGERYELFGSGGGQALADDLDVPLLAQLPLVPLVREGADDGRPAAIADPSGEVAAKMAELAVRVASLAPARVYRKELSVS